GEPPGWVWSGAAPAAGDTAQPIPTATATSAHRLRFTVPPSAGVPPPPGKPRCGAVCPKSERVSRHGEAAYGVRNGKPGGGTGPGGGDRPARRRSLRRRSRSDVRLAASERPGVPGRDQPPLGHLPLPGRGGDREGPGDVLLVGGLPAE